MSHKEAIQLLKDNSGSHFDPRMIDAVTDIETEFDGIRLSLSDSEDAQNNSISAAGAQMDRCAKVA
jgi:HD-GYP domain-containing protein (c-di-GMP phosphodiesterase class II)